MVTENSSSRGSLSPNEGNRLRQYWSEFYSEELSDAQFYEYRNRLKGFLELLVRIKKRIDKEKEIKNDNERTTNK